MSYDIRLTNVTGKTLELNDKHCFRGGTYCIGDTKECWLNVTYNYSDYYRLAYKHGLNELEGKSGADSLKILDKMVQAIESKYKDNGKWVDSEREMHYFKDPKTGDLVSYFNYQIDQGWQEVKVKERINEGPNENYWLATAGNAIKPLFQLAFFAAQHPEGVWHIS